MLKESIHLAGKNNIEYDAIDEYFECISECSLTDDGIHCLTQCIDIHLKMEEDQ